MDGYLKKKTNLWRKNYYSDTRYSVICWWEKELPKLHGSVLNVSAGNSEIPKMLMDMKNITKYTTFDKKLYSSSKNICDVYGDVHNMPFKDEEYDNVINSQSLECYENPFLAVQNMYRVLKKGGVLLIDTPYNYSHFGHGSTPDSLKQKIPVSDYWRITFQGMKLLLLQAGFAENNIYVEHSGPTNWDYFCVMGKAIK
jgi:SAM-dependent methyltransferase